MDNQSTPQNPASPENTQGASPEQAQNPVESLGAPGAAAPADPAAQQPAAKLSPEDVAAAIAAIPGGANPPANVPVAMPVTADDVDVIEPEWVAKAESEVQKHAGDPYGEEEAIEDLQQDYLKKRYGYNVADPGGPANKPNN
jgi:hypothetical protein